MRYTVLCGLRTQDDEDDEDDDGDGGGAVDAVRSLSKRLSSRQLFEENHPLAASVSPRESKVAKVPKPPPRREGSEKQHKRTHGKRSKGRPGDGDGAEGLTRAGGSTANEVVTGATRHAGSHRWAEPVCGDAPAAAAVAAAAAPSLPPLAPRSATTGAVGHRAGSCQTHRNLGGTEGNARGLGAVDGGSGARTSRAAFMDGGSACSGLERGNGSSRCLANGGSSTSAPNAADGAEGVRRPHPHPLCRDVNRVCRRLAAWMATRKRATPAVTRRSSVPAPLHTVTHRCAPLCTVVHRYTPLECSTGVTVCNGMLRPPPLHRCNGM